MNTKDNRNINITLKNDDDNKSDILISIPMIFKKLKKYLLIWIVVAAIVFVAVFGSTTLKTMHRKPVITALVSFTHEGIEKGLDPNGMDFNKDTIKNPVVIENALTSLNLPIDELDDIRNSIDIEGLVPADAMNKILTYKNVYENANSNNLQAAQSMLDVPIFPTQFKVTFNYAGTTFSRKTAVQILNTMLEQYKDYFFDMYGYNESLGSSVTALDISSYDYTEAIEVLKTSLDTLSKYVKQLSTDDMTRFRSSITGYTFDDLYEAVETVKSIDLDKVSSYINVNNLTKDKNASIAYYEYRINELTRTQTSTEDQLASVKESIKAYEKDQIIIFGNGTDNTDTQSTQNSEQYDMMIQQKLDLTNTLATTKQNINYYRERLAALKKSTANSPDKIEQVDKQLDDVNNKISNLIENIKLTADDYYENVTFQNAYTILVPASNSMGSTLSIVMDNVTMPLIIGEAGVLAVYLMIAFIAAIKEEITAKKRKQAFEEAMTENNENEEE
ncbi:MAG: lipopolysaccharide biosynthesis protein [Ruminococcus sp.]|nr:lipopolysaccharide biosynthesis protein [Ruminococcus sp.]MDE6847860.1 lipopolysaccharide biosynthesis protein [Ruminococcus sp.]MDE7137716.1 lipopolysaccharide biosynthesis protein [Ruminococcus sp.]